MNKPKTSFTVVIKGPVAKAGSILYFSKVKGINVPKTAAKTITANNEMLTVMLSAKLYPKLKAAPRIMIEQIIAFRSPTPNSFTNF